VHGVADREGSRRRCGGGPSEVQRIAEANLTGVLPRSEPSAGRQRLRELVERIPVPAAVAFDRDARDVEINDAFAELIGIRAESSDAVVRAQTGDGMPFRYEVDGKPLAREASPLARSTRGENVPYVRLDVVRDDGARTSLAGWSTPIFDDRGDVEAAILVLQDVGVLVPVERRYRELMDSMPVLLFTADPSGAIDFVNERWANLTGARTDDFLDEGWKRFVHPDDLERTSRWIRADRARNASESEWRLRHADGTYRWIRVRAVASTDAAGRVMRYLGSGFDVDDLHRAVEAMRLLSDGGANLASDEDLETMLGKIARGAFGGLADLCIFDVLSPESGELERVAMTGPGVDEGLAEIASQQGRPSLRANHARHPVLAVLERGETIYVPVVTPSFLDATILDHRIRNAWRRIGTHSLVIVPLRSSGRTLGTLTMQRVRAERPAFDVTDVRVIEGIGLRAGVAIEKSRLNEAARDAALQLEERYRSIADVMPQLMWTRGPDGKVDWLNGRWYEYTGRGLEDDPNDDVYHADDAERARAVWAASIATGEPIELEHRIRRHDGTYRWFLTRATCTRDASGRIARWYGSDTDVDDVRRAARTLQVFADLGESLSESLGLQATVEAAMSVVVPEFADWAFINLLDEDGDLRIAAIYHSDARKKATLAAQVGEIFSRLDPVSTRARSREPVVRDVTDRDEAALIVEPGVLDAFWEVGMRSILGVPLVVSGQLRGTLNVVMHASARVFSATDVPFFAELARRFAPAIANAELYERERRVAQSFQEAALPAQLPSVPGYKFDAIYEAGRAEALIGGDWYDAFRLVDGRIVISIGDVAGSGLQAAVTMSNVRQAIRGVAQVHADPALMLEAADRTLRAETPDRFVTAFVGVIDGVGRTLSYASAGHPPPLVRAGDGSFIDLECGELPLGLRENVRGGGHTIKLPADAFLVFYTDGLIESTHDIDEGERRLRAAVADPEIVRTDSPALAIHDAVLVEGSRDDVAILTVAVGEPPDFVRWGFDALDADASRSAQRDIGRRLHAAGFGDERLALAELVIAELIGNTVRYAPGPIDVYLERDREVPVVHVLDRGPGFEFAARLPQDPFSESGRGLFLISSLAEDLHVVRRPDGGSHARVVLR
jgi:PAS domain S-box-containing protein